MIEDPGQAVVLGGLGFIGTHLSRRLSSAGWSVTVIDPVAPGTLGVSERVASLQGHVSIVHAAMEDMERVEPAIGEAHVVFDVAGNTGHLASMDDPLEDLRANLIVHVQFLQLVERMRPDLPLVVASTRQVLGQPVDGLLKDDACPRPLDVNGVNKLALENYLRVCGSTWGLRSVVLRLPNVYGPHMRVADASTGVIGGWLGQGMRGEPLVVFGSGSVRRNVLFVDDAVSAMMASVPLVSVDAQTFLVGGPELTLADTAESIALLLGVPVEEAPMPPELRAIALGSAVADDSAFRSATTWNAVTPFDEGLVNSRDFYDGHRHLYER